MIKVLVDARFYTAPPDGITRYVNSMLEALASTDTIRMHAIVRGSSTLAPDAVETMQVHDVHPVGVRNQLTGWGLRRLARDADVFHYPHFDLPMAVSNGVMTVHDLKLVRESWSGTKRNWARSVYFGGVLRAAVRRARAITVPSEYTRQDLIDYTGVPGEKVFVTLHPLSISFRDTLQAIEAEQVSSDEAGSGTVPTARPYLLYVGTDRPNKNLRRLLQAYSRLVDAGSADFDLRVIGTSYAYGREQLPEIVEKQGLSTDRVKLMGSVSESDLIRMYRGASAFILPSTFEGFGIPLIEAMACGAPVIASNVTSLPEVAGDAAIYVDPFDVDSIAEGISQVMSSESLAMDLRKRGFERVRSFTPESFADRLMAAYSFAIGN